MAPHLGHGGSETTVPMAMDKKRNLPESSPLDAILSAEMVDMLRFVGQDARTRLEMETQRCHHASQQCHVLYEAVLKQKSERDQCFSLAAADIGAYCNQAEAARSNMMDQQANGASRPLFFQNPALQREAARRPAELSQVLLRLEQQIADTNKLGTEARCRLEATTSNCAALKDFLTRVVPPVEQFLNRFGSLQEAWRAAVKEEHLFMETWQTLRQRFYAEQAATFDKWDRMVCAEAEAVFASQRLRVEGELLLVLEHYQRTLETQQALAVQFAGVLEARCKHVDSLLEEINNLHSSTYAHYLNLHHQQQQQQARGTFGADRAVELSSNSLAGYQQLVGCVAALRNHVLSCVDHVRSHQDKVLAWRLRAALQANLSFIAELLSQLDYGDGELTKQTEETLWQPSSSRRLLPDLVAVLDALRRVRSKKSALPRHANHLMLPNTAPAAMKLLSLQQRQKMSLAAVNQALSAFEKLTP